MSGCGYFIFSWCALHPRSGLMSPPLYSSMRPTGSDLVFMSGPVVSCHACPCSMVKMVLYLSSSGCSSCRCARLASLRISGLVAPWSRGACPGASCCPVPGPSSIITTSSSASSPPWPRVSSAPFTTSARGSGWSAPLCLLPAVLLCGAPRSCSCSRSVRNCSVIALWVFCAARWALRAPPFAALFSVLAPMRLQTAHMLSRVPVSSSAICGQYPRSCGPDATSGCQPSVGLQGSAASSRDSGRSLPSVAALRPVRASALAPMRFQVSLLSAVLLCGEPCPGLSSPLCSHSLSARCCSSRARFAALSVCSRMEAGGAAGVGLRPGADLPPPFAPLPLCCWGSPLPDARGPWPALPLPCHGAELTLPLPPHMARLLGPWALLLASASLALRSLVTLSLALRSLSGSTVSSSGPDPPDPNPNGLCIGSYGSWFARGPLSGSPSGSSSSGPNHPSWWSASRIISSTFCGPSASTSSAGPSPWAPALLGLCFRASLFGGAPYLATVSHLPEDSTRSRLA